MPLETREPLSSFHEGKTLEGVRLVFRVGRSEKFAQVIDFKGRQMVDETVYNGDNFDLMLTNARLMLVNLAT